MICHSDGTAMEFPVHIEDGRCDLSAFLAHISGLRGSYVISIDRDLKRRTNPQNRWLWGQIYPMILDGLNAAGWEFTSTEEVHAAMGAMFLGKDVVNIRTGETVHLARSTRELNTEEFTMYCETLRDFAREYLNVEIPDPVQEYYGG